MIAIAITAAIALAVPHAHSEDNRVGLVVQYGDGSVFMGCYPWTADLTGENLLRRAGLDVEADYGSGMGALICRIGPDGCSAQNCLCQAQTPPLRYWAYWRLDPSRGDWVYSQQGSSNRALQAGDVDGWAWGVGTVAFGAKPPKVTFEQVCPAPTVTPSPSLTFTATPVPSPTRTPPAPTSTTVPPPVAHLIASPTSSPAPTLAPSVTPVPTSTNAPAASAANAPSATPWPTDTPAPAAPTGPPTATSIAVAPTTEVEIPSATNPPPAGAVAAVSSSDVMPTATSSRGGSERRPDTPATPHPNGALRPAVTNAAPPTLAPGRSGPEIRPSPSATPDTRSVAQAPAGATVDLSRLTPAVAGASRGAVEGFNSQALAGYIAFVGLVAGLGAVLWLRRRGGP
ncbi:MAG: hypothetical protein U0822_12800 [Anaerolineae bacterium]